MNMFDSIVAPIHVRLCGFIYFAIRKQILRNFLNVCSCLLYRERQIFQVLNNKLGLFKFGSVTIPESVNRSSTELLRSSGGTSNPIAGIPDEY